MPDSGATAPYFKFVQRMKEDGITAGCAKAVAPATLPTYCPDEAVTRAQMAVSRVCQICGRNQRLSLVAAMLHQAEDRIFEPVFLTLRIEVI